MRKTDHKFVVKKIILNKPKEPAASSRDRYADNGRKQTMGKNGQFLFQDSEYEYGDAGGYDAAEESRNNINNRTNNHELF